MAAQPVYHDEFDDRLDRMTARYMTYINTMQDGLLSQMRVEKRDLLQAIAELKALHNELLQRHNALEALVMAQQGQIGHLTEMAQQQQGQINHLTEVVQQMRESMDAHARDMQNIVAEAFAHQAEETNEKFAGVFRILDEILRRLPPEQQNR